MSEHARWATDEELAEWWAEHTPSLTPLDARVTIVISDLRASLALITELQGAVEHQRGMYEREHNTVHELQQRIDNAVAAVDEAEIAARQVRDALGDYADLGGDYPGSAIARVSAVRAALTGTEGTDHG